MIEKLCRLRVLSLIYKYGCTIRRLVLNRESFRDHSPIGLENGHFRHLSLDVKNSCACPMTLPFR